MNGSPMTLAEPLAAAAATPEQLVGFLAAYLRLLMACYEAGEQGLSPRDCPVEYQQLRGLGLGTDVLLWMLYQAHLERFEAEGGARGRLAWCLSPGAAVGEGSAFALTPLGEEFGELFVAAMLVP